MLRNRLNNAFTIREYQPADRDKVVEIVTAGLLHLVLLWARRDLKGSDIHYCFKLTKLFKISTVMIGRVLIFTGYRQNCRRS
jgi:hypothetical protein